MTALNPFTNTINEEFGTTTIGATGDVIEISDTTFAKTESGLVELASRTYISHPPSFLIGVLLSLVSLTQIVLFLVSQKYLVHPFVSFGLFIAGIGMLTTMLKANKK